MDNEEHEIYMPKSYQGSAWLVFNFGDVQHRYRFGADQKRNRSVMDDLATDLQEMSEIGFINQITKQFEPISIYSDYE